MGGNLLFLQTVFALWEHNGTSLALPNQSKSKDPGSGPQLEMAASLNEKPAEAQQHTTSQSLQEAQESSGQQITWAGLISLAPKDVVSVH